MGKTGPCHHCGVTSTPLWRNGPPDKPVLCNACGSRWRTKGSLANYTPLHFRETFDAQELRASTVKTPPLKHKDQNLQKKKSCRPLENERQYDQNFHKFVRGDTTNRSSSGSGISNSDSCAHIGTTHDTTGSAQSNIWETLVPSKKRTLFPRPKASPVEKLTMDLYSILHEQQSSNYSKCLEEDLIYESGTPLGSTEIGCGVLLIRHPNSMSAEEESEASSLTTDKSFITNGNMELTSFAVNIGCKGTKSGIDERNSLTTSLAKESTRRNKISLEKLKILRGRDSPLATTDLNDIVNFEGFMKYLTHEEQQRLMKYLPNTDSLRSPQSLKIMFKSSQFSETFSYFQQLLEEGIFDLSCSGVNFEECRMLKRLVLLDLEKFKWVEYYKKIKVRLGRRKEIESSNPRFHNLTTMKRPRDFQYQDPSETEEGPMKRLKRVCKPWVSNLNDTGSKLTNEKDEHHVGNECKYFLAPTPDAISMLTPSQLTAESSDHDLLLNVPCNASFPQAELLHPPFKVKSIKNGSSSESMIAELEDSTFSSHQSSPFRNDQIQHVYDNISDRITS